MNKFTVHLLLKFGSYHNCSDLYENGKIYMNTVKYFQKLDKDAIGDKYEGISKLTNIPEGKITIKTEQKSIGPLDAKRIQIRENNRKNLGNIYSMFSITNEDIINKKEYRFPKYISKHWDYCVIIKDNQWFIDSVKNKLSEMGYKYYMQPVEYIDMNVQNGKIGPFHKTELLKDQNEFRIYVPNQNEEILEFNIGSLKNKSILLSTKDLIDNETWVELY